MRELLKKTRTLCKKYLFLISAILGLLLVVFASIRYPELGEFEPFPDSVSREECEVYDLFIKEKLIWCHTSPPYYKADLIVMRSTSELNEDHLDWDEILFWAPMQLEGLTPQMAWDFKEKNQESYPIDCDFDLSICEAISKEEGEFHSFIHARLFFSRVGFNLMGDKAIVYVAESSGILSGHGTLYFLKKEFGEWKIVDSIWLWIS